MVQSDAEAVEARCDHLTPLETVEIDGEPWEIKQALDDFWIGSGGTPPNRGCIVSARTREGLIAGIPGARDKHELASMAMSMQAAIVTAFKAVLEQSIRNRHVTADDLAKLKQMQALGAELWPWVFDATMLREIAGESK